MDRILLVAWLMPATELMLHGKVPLRDAPGLSKAPLASACLRGLKGCVLLDAR